MRKHEMHKHGSQSRSAPPNRRIMRPPLPNQPYRPLSPTWFGRAPEGNARVRWNMWPTPAGSLRRFFLQCLE